MSMEQLTKEHKVQFYTKVKFLYGITLNSTFSFYPIIIGGVHRTFTLCEIVAF